MRILAVSLLMAWCLSGLLTNMPNVVKPNVLSAPSSSLSGSVRVFQRGERDSGADDTVVRWKTSFNQNPALAVVKSIAHTLFAPYPWVALSPGLTWNLANELYYPGMVFWIFYLPGIFWALWHGVRKRDPSFWLLAFFLASQLAAYTIFFGEWSTRQRVFALPAFYALAAIGWAGLYRRWLELRMKIPEKQSE